MASLPNPLPVVLCGRRAEVGKPVAELLLPEYEVVHFITTNEACLSDIPRLLSGQKPQSADESGVGTQNYSKTARAVIFGRGYDITEVEQFRKASDGSNVHPVAWITGDPNRKPGPNDPPPGPGYAQFAAEQVKGKLNKWRDEGATKDGIILW
ncbi:uncharacterized protein N7482_004297 [Penicillium canariense]|uniref:Uncharacterized protein n=1 Tax=Penicillium canariense TaxID=189055 RepID=A0A9W9I8E8_9EURO|nr:uncharacterized protein N7482_004297 [Penicillium canariense]KAJ5168703.1 hypothetical protein N7482_004297 [Penicillium canariense]